MTPQIFNIIICRTLVHNYNDIDIIFSKHKQY